MQPAQFKSISRILPICLLLVGALMISSCQTFSARTEFSQVFAARFIPEQLVVLDRAEKTGEKGPRIFMTGAVSNADEFGRWGLVWAEYGIDNRGEWFRKRFADDPVTFAKDMEEARKKSGELVTQFVQSEDEPGLRTRLLQ